MYIYGATCAPLKDQKLQDKREKSDFSRKRTLYRILQVRNLEKLANMELVGSFCRIEIRKLLTYTLTHKVSTVITPRVHEPSFNHIQRTQHLTAILDIILKLL